jgi:hypothetical protein
MVNYGKTLLKKKVFLVKVGLSQKKILNLFPNCDEIQSHHTHFESVGFSHLKCGSMFENNIHTLWIDA